MTTKTHKTTSKPSTKNTKTVARKQLPVEQQPVVQSVIAPVATDTTKADMEATKLVERAKRDAQRMRDADERRKAREAEKLAKASARDAEKLKRDSASYEAHTAREAAKAEKAKTKAERDALREKAKQAKALIRAERDNERMVKRAEREAKQRQQEQQRAEALQELERVQEQAAAMVAAARAKVRAAGGRVGMVDAARKAAYTVTKIEGRRVIDNDDPVSRAVRGKALVDLYSIAAKILRESVEELRAAYGKLNPGQQSMSLRNRIRAAYRDDNSVLAWEVQ